MKSYLSLVIEYAKVHKKKNRLTILCIVISVMLVTAVFGMADISMQAQTDAFIRQQGNFHAVIKGITDDVAARIGSRGDIKISDWTGVAEDAVYEGRPLWIQGSGQEFAAEMNLVVAEGEYPKTAQEALMNKRALEEFGLSLGDTISVPFSDGQTRKYLITGTFDGISALSSNDAYALFLSVEGVRAIKSEQYAEYYYLQFEKGVNIRRALSEIKSEYGLSAGQISENTRLLGMMGQSDDNAMGQIYLTAGGLFVLVMLSGIFMIAGSFNMSVLERTEFFGLLRCLGASKRQIKNYIMLEGLLYCLKGIPLGLLAGCFITWISVFVFNILNLRFVLPEMPLFQVSLPGIVAGAAMGFLVVMLASRAPAGKAARISPQAAVTGNLHQSENSKFKGSVNTRFHIDTSMGIHHAFSYKKNMLLTAGSFSLSIILLLSFTVLIDFMEHAINPLKPYAPDITVLGNDGSVTIPRSVMEEIRELPNIKRLYGRMFLYDIPSSGKGQEGNAMLISYDEPQFHWAEKMLVEGEIAAALNGGGVLVGFEEAKKYNWEIGDEITLNISGNSHKLMIEAILSDIPFNDAKSQWPLICSEKTFIRLTGRDAYTVIDMQTETDISSQVRSVIPPELKLLDKQMSNQETITAYYTMAVFVYGFVFVIALVAFINILNMINASISGRMGNYGMMRSVGMSMRQLKKMVIAEAASYTFVGSLAGSILGLLLHRFFFLNIVTSNWGSPWSPPIVLLFITVSAAIFTTLIAVVAPIKKIERMSIVNLVNV